MAPGVHLAFLLILDVVKAVLLVQEKLAAVSALDNMSAVRISRMVYKLLIVSELLMTVIAIVFFVVE